MDTPRKCPWCAEEIAAEAVRCPHCRSRLAALDPERWHRDHADRRLAGVAAALARALAVPVGAVRLGFLVLTFVHLLGPILYAALWVLIPFAPGTDAPLARALSWLKSAPRRLLGHPALPSGPGRTEPLERGSVP